MSAHDWATLSQTRSGIDRAVQVYRQDTIVSRGQKRARTLLRIDNIESQSVVKVEVWVVAQGWTEVARLDAEDADVAALIANPYSTDTEEKVRTLNALHNRLVNLAETIIW